MRLHRKIILFALLGTACIARTSSAQSTAAAEETSSPTLTWTYESGLYSRYVWRGFADYSGPSWQNSVRLSYGPVGGSWWTESGSEPSTGFLVREHDLELHYTRQVSRAFITAGYTAYWTRLDDSLAHELYLTASYGKTWVGTASLYQNVGSLAGTYLAAGLAHETRLSHSWAAQFNGTIGFNRKMYIPEDTFSDLTLTVSLIHPTHSKISVSPTFGFSKSLNRRYFANQAYAGLVLRLGSPD